MNSYNSLFFFKILSILMPIYEYHCNKCNIEFEELVQSDTEQVICKKCNSSDLIKLYSSFGVNSSNEADFSNNDVAATTGCCINSGCGCN